jgi:hypothetical protein
MTSAGGQVAGSATVTGGYDHAFAWLTSAGTGVDLSTSLPSSLIKSYAQGTDGSQQVGYGEASSGAYSDQAMLWSGSAGSVVNLNPTDLPGISDSEAFGVNPGQQVGYGQGSGTGFNSHAILWTGTANSAVDLNPVNFNITISTAFSTDGSNQVGFGNGPDTGNNPHALLWTNTAASAVDLNPSGLGISSSQAYGASGSQEVGSGAGAGTANYTHALLWTGTAVSAVDLNPTNLPGYSASAATSTNASQQVGYGTGSGTSSNSHALLWSGTAGSAVDLQTLLPSAGTWISSYASSINSSGDVYGIARGTLNNVTGYYAVEWAPIATSSVVDIGTGFLDSTSDSLTDLISQVRQGYNGGAWNGTTGITSSAAASDTTHLTAVGIIQNNQGGSPIYSSSNPFEGQSPGASDVLLKYTYYGDANLDGKVDGSDYSLIDNGYLKGLTGWFNGDFNYDGVVNGSDYTLIDNAFNAQGSQFTSQIAQTTAELAAHPVPEPASLVFLYFVPLTLLRRRVARQR